ncbi:SDR family oxidoreductase [Myxococcota bacterium]|nr:SDR family oxidoreductase [Myxococcota bacterium]
MSEAAPKAIVTGATRGIGKGIAEELADAGFDVAITGRTAREGEGMEEEADGSPSPLPGSLETTAGLIEARGRVALPVPMDLLDPVSVDRAAKEILGAWGHVDVLVNNAMYEMGRYTNAWVKDTPLVEWERKAQANFLAPVALVLAFLPGMLERRSGCIVNLSTRHNYQRQGGPPGAGGAGVSYNCSKAALGKLADGIAVEHGADGILAFDVDPGPVLTERGEKHGDSLGYPVDIFCPLAVPAKCVRWLVTETEARQYNGAHFMAQEFVRARGLHEEWSSSLPMNARWSPTAILDWRERNV